MLFSGMLCVMMKMKISKHKIRLSLTIFFLIIGLVFGILWLQRLQLDYNSEGRYFDQEQGIVYTDNGIVAYGTVAFVSLLIGTFFLVVKSKKLRK